MPDELKKFVDAEVTSGGYGSTSEYVRDLIRQAQDRKYLRSVMLDGASSPIVADADQFIDGLRSRSATT